MQLTEKIIKKLKEFDLYTDNEEALSLLSHYVPMESTYYHKQKTPSKFKNIHLLQESANRKIETGRYCPYLFKSRQYNEWAIEEIRRCKEGYTINKGTKYELSITGYHYFFLNYKMLKFELEDSDAAQGRDWQFPNFMEIQYHFFWAFQEALKNRQNFIVLKPRGIGFSEMVASIACCNYVLYKDSNFLFAMQEDTLIKDGIYTKVTDNIDFLNAESDRLFYHSRITDKTLHKIAGLKYKTFNKRTGGEIIGKVIDSPRKARGSRGMLIGFEEAGSFKDLIKAFNTALASIKQTGGKQFGTILVWGTGGDEQSEYLEGLKSMFDAPDSYNAKEFKNKWSKEHYNKPCGWFAPTYYYSPDYTDAEGNIDTLSAFLALMKERIRDAKNSLDDKNIQQRSEEYPITPEEALLKKGRSIFNREALSKQLYKLEMNPDIIKAWHNGWLIRTPEGRLMFNHSGHYPLEDYPIRPDVTGKLKGCISIMEFPVRVENMQVPPGYLMSVDGYYSDQSEHSDSVGAIYIVKPYSKYFPINEFSGNIVARYVGRPETTDKFCKIAFDLAEFYNCKIQFETRGGGIHLLKYARQHKKERWLAPSLATLDKAVKLSSNSYGNNFSKEANLQGLKMLAEWLEKEVERDEEKLTYKLRLHYIYDVGLLRELINFVEGRNYDRISAMRQLMYVLKEDDINEARQPLVNPFKILNEKMNEWFK